MQENEMGWECSTGWRDKRCIQRSVWITRKEATWETKT